jgi:hypothetical protein
MLAEIRQDAQATPRDEARRIAANIPKLLRGSPQLSEE